MGAQRSRNRDGQTIVHSDHGGNFTSWGFSENRSNWELTYSLGSVGDAYDNAAMESFLALLQKNVLDRQRWATRSELRLALITWIERTYHRRRRQPRLAWLTPVEYETMMTTTALQAA